MSNEQVIDSAEKYYAEILEPQYREFFKNPATLLSAFNLAGALFHFHEWIYEYHKISLETHFGKSLPTNGALWKHAEKVDTRFGYVRDLANASKHVRLTQKPSTAVNHIANTTFHVGTFDSGSFDSGSFDTGGVKMKDQSQNISFDDCASALFTFWTDTLNAVK
jgi:hypothetical protein